MKVCLAPTHLFWNVRLGGHAWVFLNWALGLQAIGAEILILEKARPDVEPEALAARLEQFQSSLRALGLKVRVALFGFADDGEIEPPKPYGITLDEAVAEADLFLNFRYGLPQRIVERFRCSALVDIDPGLLQLWISSGQVSPARHDLYFTIGETVGQPGARFPDCGIDWNHCPPPVFLPAWPVSGSDPDAPYTTVTNWWGEYEVVNGEWINNEKRTNFLDYLDLPSRTDATFELAIFHREGNHSDMPMLREHGWRARPAFEVSATPERYRAYIQASRGEFSCAKQTCMHFANAWISDRTLCYLASGKPAIVQHTGESRILPDDEGLCRFRTLDEAARQLTSVEADYARHARAARRIVEQHFDATTVASQLLDRALNTRTSRRDST